MERTVAASGNSWENLRAYQPRVFKYSLKEGRRALQSNLLVMEGAGVQKYYE
jgi:hypothetical protein